MKASYLFGSSTIFNIRCCRKLCVCVWNKNDTWKGEAINIVWACGYGKEEDWCRKTWRDLLMWKIKKTTQNTIRTVCENCIRNRTHHSILILFLLTFHNILCLVLGLLWPATCYFIIHLFMSNVKCVYVHCHRHKWTCGTLKITVYISVSQSGWRVPTGGRWKNSAVMIMALNKNRWCWNNKERQICTDFQVQIQKNIYNHKNGSSKIANNGSSYESSYINFTLVLLYNYGENILNYISFNKFSLFPFSTWRQHGFRDVTNLVLTE